MSGIQTHIIKMNGTWKQRLRPPGDPANIVNTVKGMLLFIFELSFDR